MIVPRTTDRSEFASISLQSITNRMNAPFTRSELALLVESEELKHQYTGLVCMD